MCEMLDTGNISLVSLILTKIISKAHIWKGKREIRISSCDPTVRVDTHYSARGIKTKLQFTKKDVTKFKLTFSIIQSHHMPPLKKRNSISSITKKHTFLSLCYG
jgi:hypothetical protein